MTAKLSNSSAQLRNIDYCVDSVMSSQLMHHSI